MDNGISKLLAAILLIIIILTCPLTIRIPARLVTNDTGELATSYSVVGSGNHYLISIGVWDSGICVYLGVVDNPKCAFIK